MEKSKNKFSKLKKIYTILILLYPILGVYSTPISTLSLGDIMLFILIPFMMVRYIKEQTKIRQIISWPFLIIAIYTMTQILINMIFKTNPFSYYLTAIRMLFYFLVLGTFSKSFFDKKYAIKVYRITALFAAIFCILQVILLKGFGFFLQGTIPGLPLRTDYLTNYNENMLNGGINASYNRPRSIFTEPSHFAIYVSLYLSIILLSDSIEKRKKDIIITTISLLLSGSGTAIILTAIIYMIFVFRNLKKLSKKTILIGAICTIIVASFIPAYMKTESFNVFYYRTFEKGDSVDGRFKNYSKTFLNYDLPISEMIFGKGIVKITKAEDYLTSVPAIYYYYGIMGIVGYIFLCIYWFKKLKGVSKITWFILFVLAFEAEILFHSRLLLFASFIVSDTEKVN